MFFAFRKGAGMRYSRPIHCFTFAALVLLAASSALAAASPPITWSPASVNCSIGNGSGPTGDVIVTLTSQSLLADVDLRVVPGLAEFVEVIPNRLPQVVPGQSYEVRLRFSVAPGAEEQAYDGVIQARVGTRVIARPLPVTVNVEFGDITIPATTKVLARESLEALVEIEVTSTGRVLRFTDDPADVARLVAGDILVANICAAAPMGFLGRVTAVEPAIDGLRVYTVPAALDEAVEEGTVNLSMQLQGADIAQSGLPQARPDNSSDMLTFYADDLVVYDDDGNLDTDNDQILADGSIGVGLAFDFTAAISGNHLRYLSNTAMLQEETALTFHVDVPLRTINGEANVGTPTYFSPVVVWAGFVPVVLVPELGVVAAFEGSVSAGIEAGVTQDASMTVGIIYDNGTWSPVSEIDHDIDAEPPHFTLGCDVKGSIGPEFSLLLYGVTGPYVEVAGYVELEVDLLPSPAWELYGGVEANVGVRFEVLGHEIADHDIPGVIGIRVLLAHSETNPGNIAGQVSDALTRQTLSDVAVDVVDLSGHPVASGLSGPSGSFLIPVRSGKYQVNFTKSGYLAVQYLDVDVVDGETKFLEAVLQIDQSHGGIGIASGRILDALSGVGVAGLTIDLRSGMNAVVGPVVATSTSGSNGNYRFSGLMAGNYTAEVHGLGYLTTRFAVLCIGGRETDSQNAVVTPILPPGQIRIVLTWGASPSDLDSHTFGPLPGGDSFHMYYPYAQSNSGSPWPQQVTLDLDDVTSYGPETTTLLQQMPGVYQFVVHDFTNRLSTSTTALSTSGAIVRVYNEQGLVVWFPVPTGQEGTLWTVFEMDGGVITPVNSLGYAWSQLAHATTNDLVGFDWSTLPYKSGDDGDGRSIIAAEPALETNVPNPFNPATKIRFALPYATDVDLAIYDAAGRLVVRLLADETREAGLHEIMWQGRDGDGRSVAAGNYICRLSAGRSVTTRLITLIK